MNINIYTALTKCDKILKSQKIDGGVSFMIQVQYMKPFFTRISGATLRLVFAYQYFSIMKDDELFHFVPLEGKEMKINLMTHKIENLTEVFVFQKGKRFIKIPLYQLLVISNLHEYLTPLLEQFPIENTVTESESLQSEVDQLILNLEIQNFNYLIDEALQNRDQHLFNQLVQNRAFLLEDYPREA